MLAGAAHRRTPPGRGEAPDRFSAMESGIELRGETTWAHDLAITHRRIG
jgi:hypothetical protein